MKSNFDFGIITENNHGSIDIPIKNISDKVVYVFRFDVDKRFEILISDKKIMPDSTSYVRLAFNPDKKGVVNEKIVLHLSCLEKPKIITLNGYVKEIPLASITCPTFIEQKANLSALDFMLNIEVVDKLTKEPVEKAGVLIIKDGVKRHEAYTSNNGNLRLKTLLGLYYFIILKERYLTSERVEYINRHNNTLIFELSRKDSLIQSRNYTDISKDSTLVYETDTSLIVQDIFTDSSILNKSKRDTIIEKHPDFSLLNFSPNNIVFLLDVSTSMKYTGKMDLLKASMYELTDLLREVDQLTIIAYASQTKVLLQTTTGNQKDSIKNVLRNLTPKGLTAGGKGLKLAYENAIKGFLVNGNNEIIIVTDGDFNKGEENVYKLAKKYRKKGVKISVIGIKNSPFAGTNMKAIAEKGGGNYISVTNYENAVFSLVNEIKTNSLIRFNK